MNESKQSLKTVLAWHTIEAFGYHICLLAHHILFFLVASRPLYGQIGSIFSMLYLATTVILLGVVDTITIFFPDFSLSQEQTRKFLIKQSSYTFYAIGILIALCCYLLHTNTMLNVFTPTTLILTMFAIIIEVIKRIVKRIVRLTGQLVIVASSSIVSVLLFLAIVWIPFFGLKSDLQIPTMLTALVLVSLIESGLYIFYTYTWYKTLPEKGEGQISHQRIVKNRLNTILLEIERLSISGNLLVPAVAITHSLEYAAILKLTSSIIHNSLAIVEKIINRTNIIFLAKHKYTNIQKGVSLATTMAYAYNIVLAITIIGALLLQSSSTFSMISGTFLLYQIIQLLHKIKDPYTQLLIMQEHTLIIAILSTFQVCVTGFIFYAQLDQITSLITLTITIFMSYVAILVAIKKFQKIT